MNNKPKRFITVEEAAEELSVSIETIRRYIRSGKLPATRLNKGYRIERPQFDKAFGVKPPPPSHEEIPLSNVAETLLELVDELTTIDEVGDLVEKLDPERRYIFNRIKEQDVRSVKKAVKLFIEYEKEESKQIRQLLKENTESDNLIVFLPLPPHIPLQNVKQGFIYNTEDKIPHHAKDFPYINLTDETSTKVFENADKYTAVMVDGQRFNDRLLVRTNVAPLLQILFSKNITRLFFHRIPHIPKGQHFTTITLPQSLKIFYI